MTISTVIELLQNECRTGMNRDEESCKEGDYARAAYWNGYVIAMRYILSFINAIWED